MAAGIVTICSSGERKYLREFIAHYSNLGFGRFYVYEHNNPDDMTAEKEFWRNFDGKVSFHDAQETWVTEDIQMDNYQCAVNIAKGENIDWLLPVDLDEYLVLRKHKNIQELVDSIPDEVSQIYFSWRLYGSNGEEKEDTSRVDFEKYTRFAKPNWTSSLSGKGMVRVNSVVKMDIHIHDVEGESVNGELTPLVKINRNLQNKQYDDVGWISHFRLRSKEEFQSKLKRGYPSKWHGGGLNEGYFNRHDKNDISNPEDLSPVISALKNRLGAWKKKNYEFSAVPTNISNGRVLKVKLVPKKDSPAIVENTQRETNENYLIPISLFDPLVNYIKERGKVLVIVPYGNIGDDFIQEGMRHLFRVKGVQYETIHVSALRTMRLDKFPKFDVLAWGGGGNVAGRYNVDSLVNAAGKLAVWNKTPFICFPQSLEEWKPYCSQFTKMFLRDIRSVTWALDKGVDTVLIPDLALAYPALPVSPEGDYKKQFFRADSESITDKHKTNDPRRKGITFKEFLDTAASADIIETDLFHFSVAALNRGKRVILHSTDWHKTQSMYATWLHQTGRIQFVPIDPEDKVKGISNNK